MKLQCDDCLNEELDLTELGLDEYVNEETGEIHLCDLVDELDPALCDEGWVLKCTLDDGCLVLCAKGPECLEAGEEDDDDEMKQKAQEELDALRADLGEEAPSAGAAPAGGCQCCCAPPAPRVDPEEERKKKLAAEELDALNAEFGE